MTQGALQFNVLAKCSTSKARSSKLRLPHQVVDTPVFMPVGTQGTMKGLTMKQMKDLGCQIFLGNTYHLGLKPGQALMRKLGGLHAFMNWDRALLTDSGGFQMVSLLKLAKVTEEGVNFLSPRDGTPMMLTPEKSIEIQNDIGADILMQLDDVVATLTEAGRMKEAMERSIRWLDRCIAAHARPHDQNLFAIIQGGLDLDLRRICIEEMVQRDLPGYAIGGLAGGEDKESFWRVVHHCTNLLPRNKPIYCMGIGYAIDLVVCSALGVDMYDCVFPTRTARFGNALVPSGRLALKQARYAQDHTPIDANCTCYTCRHYTRAYLHGIVHNETVACHLLSIHNIAYQLNLMASIRRAIEADRFPAFVRGFLRDMYGHVDAYPTWVVHAMQAVDIDVMSDKATSCAPVDAVGN